MDDNTLIKKIEKLLIDDSSDFSFHAAYLAYSKAWDENFNEETRLDLNNIMLAIAEKRDDYSTFYQRINGYRQDIQEDYNTRNKFRAQSKSAWRKNEAKKERIGRHKK